MVVLGQRRDAPTSTAPDDGEAYLVTGIEESGSRSGGFQTSITGKKV
jgi:hypothetical protein